MCPRILKQSCYNLHKKHYTACIACSKKTLKMLLENLKNPSQIPSRAPPNAPQIHLGTPWNQTWKKRPNYALKGAPREPKILPKSTQGGARAPNWRTFVVKMPLLKASRFLNAFLHVFWCFFEGPEPKNSMVFTSPNQLSLLLQKSAFLSLFGPLLAPKMLTFGIHWRPEGD